MSKKKVSAKQNPQPATQSWAQWFDSLFKKKKIETDATSEKDKPIAMGPTKSSKLNNPGRWSVMIAVAAGVVGLGVVTGGIGPLILAGGIAAATIGIHAARVKSLRNKEQAANQNAVSASPAQNASSQATNNTDSNTANKARTTAATANNSNAHQQPAVGPAAKVIPALNAFSSQSTAEVKQHGEKEKYEPPRPRQ